VVRKLLLSSGVVVAALVASAGATTSHGAAARPPAFTVPVPSLTPVATERLWRRLVERGPVYRSSTAACAPLRAVFYSPTDWRRLTTKLAATASPCAQYYVSVPPLAADKTVFRADEAWRIRALGPAFHALAEVNVTGWTAWVAAEERSWYEAGVEARRRMALAGYDVAAGDTWALNELSSAVRQGTGNARANMRAFLNGLYDGDGSAPTRGVVFTVGLNQGTADLSVYQARLQDWYEDEAFWNDLSRVASDWSQELYGDVRNYAAAGVARDERRDALNEYLQHQTALAAAAPASGSAARSFLGSFYAPLANAAWQYDAAFGWTNVPIALMQDYVSAQTFALRAAGNGRFGFAWSPKIPAGMSQGDFIAQTDALLVRLAAAIADSSESPEAACGASWCAGALDDAALTQAWRTFAAWKPSQLAFTTAPQTLTPGVASGPITVELRTAAGGAYAAGLPVPVTLTSSSATGELALDPAGTWSPTLVTQIPSGATTTSVYFRAASGGAVTLNAAAAGKTAGSQLATVTEPPAPAPGPPAPGGGGGGAAPDLAVAASAAPFAPRLGETVTYTVTLRNHGSPASRVLLSVRLPAEVEYAGSESDRGPGCTVGVPPTLACDLDFLSGDLVATLRVRAVVRRAGSLVFAATSSAQPADGQPANDAAAVTTTVVAPATATAPAPARNPAPALRAVGAPPAKVARRGRVATVSVRFSVSEAARLEARLTPRSSRKSLALLPLTSLAGTRSATSRAVATAVVRRAGGYVFVARVPAAKLARGRAFVVRVTAVDAAGQRRTLIVPVRA
jgi:uncharacterized repeat protein (TIGR01451 family)